MSSRYWVKQFQYHVIVSFNYIDILGVSFLFLSLVK